MPQRFRAVSLMSDAPDSRERVRLYADFGLMTPFSAQLHTPRDYSSWGHYDTSRKVAGWRTGEVTVCLQFT
jgi:hypothetical protein